MFKKIMALCVLFGVFSCSCYSESFTFSRSNSGCLNPGGYYYYYVYQYVYHYNGKVLSESHSFTFSGALSDDDNPTLLGMNDSWMIYEGKKHYIAIPCVSGECIYVMDKTVSSFPSPGKGRAWQQISEPIK
jgi:hypothetical protein